MHLLNSDETTHTLKFISRIDNPEDITLELKNEFTGEKNILTAEYSFLNGISFLTFNFEFKDQEKKELTIKSAQDVIYRGLFFAEKTQTNTEILL